MPEILIKRMNSIVDITLTEIVEYISSDLREQTGIAQPKILIACDEVGRRGNEEKLVALLCSLVDQGNDLECFFTGLTLNQFEFRTGYKIR